MTHEFYPTPKRISNFSQNYSNFQKTDKYKKQNMLTMNRIKPKLVFSLKKSESRSKFVVMVS